METGDKLKSFLSAYLTAKDWYYEEKLTEEEYIEQIGEWRDYTPEEIADEWCKYIQSL